VQRSARSRLLILAAGCALGVAAPAAAAVNPSSLDLHCSPDSVATGAARACTVTITDAGTSAQTTPTGEVTFSSAPTTGSFSGSGSCAPAPAGASSASCTVSFNATQGGDYTLTANFAGDATHTVSVGTTSLTVVDATATSFACDTTSPPINTSAICTATLTDIGSPHAPVGEIGFTSSQATGTFASPGQCPWNPAASGMGGTATCQVTFSATAPGPYTLTASYGGDDTHAASAGSTVVTVTTALTNGGPGAANPGGLSLPIDSGPLTPSVPDPGTIKIAGGSAKVSTHHVAGVRLSCSGSKGATCTGILTLTAPIKVKVKEKVKKKVKVKVKGHLKTRTKTVTRTVTKTTLLKLGSVAYTVRAGTKPAVSVTLSKQAVALLAKAAHHKLKVSAAAAGVVRSVVLTAPAAKRKAKSKSKHKSKSKSKSKTKHR
jgi:hypothetical protein